MLIVKQNCGRGIRNVRRSHAQHLISMGLTNISSVNTSQSLETVLMVQSVHLLTLKKSCNHG